MSADWFSTWLDDAERACVALCPHPERVCDEALLLCFIDNLSPTEAANHFAQQQPRDPQAA